LQAPKLRTSAIRASNAPLWLECRAAYQRGLEIAIPLQNQINCVAGIGITRAGERQEPICFCEDSGWSEQLLFAPPIAAGRITKLRSLAASSSRPSLRHGCTLSLLFSQRHYSHKLGEEVCAMRNLNREWCHAA
jgi:hypothetical protein